MPKLYTLINEEQDLYPVTTAATSWSVFEKEVPDPVWV
jgi:hypothetical protein